MRRTAFVALLLCRCLVTKPIVSSTGTVTLQSEAPPARASLQTVPTGVLVFEGTATAYGVPVRVALFDGDVEIAAKDVPTGTSSFSFRLPLPEGEAGVEHRYRINGTTFTVVVDTMIDVACTKAIATLGAPITCVASNDGAPLAVTWSASNGASVSPAGVVTTTSAGATTMTATAIAAPDRDAGTTVTIVEPAVAPPITAPTIVTAGDTALMASASPVAAQTYVWSIDNGTIDAQTAAAAQFTAGAPGTATITLTATNAAGDSDASTKSLTIVAAPTPCAITTAAHVSVGKVGATASTPAVPGHSYAWQLSAGTITAGGSSASMTYTAAGSPTTATISCRATNAAGAFADAQTMVDVVALASPCAVTAFASVTVGRNGLSASTAAQAGMDFGWTVAGAPTGGTGNTLTYTAPPTAGMFDIGCSACNVAGDCTAPATRAVTAYDKGMVLLYGVLGSTGLVDGSQGGGTPPRFNSPRGLSTADDGTLFIADYGNKCVRRQGIGGAINTISGINCTPGATTLTGPQGVAARLVLPGKYEVFIADSDGHCIWEQYHTNPAIVVAGSCGVPGTADAPTGTNARFNSPTDIVLDEPRGYVYITEYGNNSVRRMSLAPPHAVETIVGLPGAAGAGAPHGTLATPIPGATVRLYNPHALALSSDRTTLVNVRNGAGADVVFTLLGTPMFDSYQPVPGTPGGTVRHAAFDFSGVLHVTATGENLIRRIDGTTVAGNGASALSLPSALPGSFDDPDGIVVDPNNGDLLVSSSNQHVIVRVRQ